MGTTAACVICSIITFLAARLPNGRGVGSIGEGAAAALAGAETRLGDGDGTGGLLGTKGFEATTGGLDGLLGVSLGGFEGLDGALAAAWLGALAACLVGATLVAGLAAAFGTTLVTDFAAAFLAGCLEAGALLPVGADDANGFACFALAGEADLAPAFTAEAAADGRPLAPDAAGWAVLAVPVGGTFTTGLISDPDDARSSGWCEAETGVFRATPLAG